MKMSEKNERSRRHAAAALDAYRAAYTPPGTPDPDDVACIGDLIVDLCHLAAQAWKEQEAELVDGEIAYDGAVSVHGFVLTQLDHYDHERDPAHANDEVWTNVEQERNRAVRIAYQHARRGDDTTTARWLDVAATFARPSQRQLEHARALLRASGPVVIPGQLDLVHTMAVAQAAHARSRGYRDAATRYGD